MSCIGIILLVCLTLIVVVHIFLVWASADVGSNIYVDAYCKAKCDERYVALTFDDGPDVKNSAKVLDVLKRHNIRATFFLWGERVEREPQLVARMVAEGHIVANHTQSHTAAFTIGNRARVEEEIKRCSDAIYRVAGVRPLLFRPPFGVTTPLIGRVIKDMELKVIGWSVRSYDTLHRRTRKSVVDGVMRKIHPGAIILLHDRCNNVDELLEMLIKEGTERGYRFVALDEMLKIKVYED